MNIADTPAQANHTQANHIQANHTRAERNPLVPPPFGPAMPAQRRVPPRGLAPAGA